jgi:hypothetical protein
MRNARNFSLLAVMAVAMALTAPTVSATNVITVTNADGTMCPHLPTGCKIHMEGEMTTYFHIFGIESTEWECHIELRGTASSGGFGEITAQTITPGNHDKDCLNATQPPCSGSLPWPWQAERDADGVVRVHYDLCLAPFELSGSTCSGEFITTLSEIGLPVEVQTQSASDLRVGASSFCELDLTLTSEAVAPEGQEIHVKGN